jgi:hypothetical protein
LTQSIELNVNGARSVVTAEPGTPLIYVLRNDLKLTGAALACADAARCCWTGAASNHATPRYRRWRAGRSPRSDAFGATNGGRMRGVPKSDNRFVWYSTPQTVEAGSISLLAMVETLAAVWLYWELAAWWGDQRSLWVAIVAVPLLLLR